MSEPTILEIQSKRTAQAYQRIRNRSLLIPFILGAAIFQVLISVVFPQASGHSSGLLIALLALALWLENRRLNALIKVLDQSERLQ